MLGLSPKICGIPPAVDLGLSAVCFQADSLPQSLASADHSDLFQCGYSHFINALAYAAAEQMTPADQQLIPQALELIRNKPLRSFRIDIASDSLVMLDENQNKQDRLQFLQAFGGFLAQALPVGQASPEMVPMMMELLRFGMQAFKAARPIEGQIDSTLQQLQQAAAQQQPDGEQQGKQAELQQKGQIEASKMQMESALTQAKLQHEMQMEQLRNQAKMAMEQQKYLLKPWMEK